MIGDYVKKAIKLNNEIYHLKHVSKTNPYEETKNSLFFCLFFACLLIFEYGLYFCFTGHFEFFDILPVKIDLFNFLICFFALSVALCSYFGTLLNFDELFQTKADFLIFAIFIVPIVLTSLSLIPFIFFLFAGLAFIFVVFYSIKEKLHIEIIYRQYYKKENKSEQHLSELIKEEQNLILKISNDNDELTYLVEHQNPIKPDQELLISKIISYRENIESNKDKINLIIRTNKSKQLHQLSNI